VMVNVRRVMRTEDQVLLQEHVGAAIILPDVDAQGAYSILERVYRSISLLQAETVIPPLELDTTLLMGMGTYPESGPSVEQLLYSAGMTARRFTLRSAITTQMWDMQSLLAAEDEREDEQAQGSKGQPGVPFMRLPKEVPQRLKHFLPYPLALELRCAPVGRDHHCLTVAMVDPTGSGNIDRLRAVTGMAIFPVCCDLEELYTLLAKKW
jgi:Type II secretion system (T2SS), protein E, N-terminal domain